MDQTRQDDFFAQAPARAGWQDGWSARLSLEYAARAGRSVIVSRRHHGPLLVQRAFYPEGPDLAHTYLLHPPGGIVGGDQLDLSLLAQSGAQCLLTTPGATKLYRSPGRPSRQRQRIWVESGAQVEWFPQETILFSGTESESSLEICLEAQGPLGPARFSGWEILVAGRPACAERFERGRFVSRVVLRVDGRPLLFERLDLAAGGSLLDAPFGLRSAPVLASFWASGLGRPQAELRALAEQARAAAEAELPVAPGEWRGLSAVSLPPPGRGLENSSLGLIVGRYLGSSVERARAWMLALWRSLRPLLLGRPACVPRIWAT